MKNKLTFLLICGIAMMMAACSGSSNGKPMSGARLTEYNETVAKVQQIENLLCEFVTRHGFTVRRTTTSCHHHGNATNKRVGKFVFHFLIGHYVFISVLFLCSAKVVFFRWVGKKCVGSSWFFWLPWGCQRVLVAWFSCSV